MTIGSIMPRPHISKTLGEFSFTMVAGSYEMDDAKYIGYASSAYIPTPFGSISREPIRRGYLFLGFFIFVTVGDDRAFLMDFGVNFGYPDFPNDGSQFVRSILEGKELYIDGVKQSLVQWNDWGATFAEPYFEFEDGETYLIEIK